MLDNLDEVITGDTDRLMIFMPPGSAKTRYSSLLLPPYIFRRRPEWHIIGASHTSDKAEENSSYIQSYIRDNPEILEYELASRRVDRWRTTAGGQYLAVGAGNALPGYRADLVIIDDPIKGRNAVDNQSNRDHIYSWFWGDLRQRLRVGGRIILMHTRWHEDDLAGRLLRTQPERWKILKLPAVAGLNDPLLRQPGEMLWADDANYAFGAELAAKQAELEAVGASREWASQFQQEPAPPEGSIFKTARLNFIDHSEIPAGVRWVRAWDLAATRETGTNDPDATAGVKLGLTKDDKFIVGDAVFVKGGPDEVLALIQQTARADGFSTKIGLPQDPGQSGKAQVLHLTRQLAGFMVVSSLETGDKATRAGPFAGQVNVGNVSMVRGAWNDAVKAEFASFPSGRHDDFVDASSRAFMLLDPASLMVWRKAAGLA